MKATKRLLWVLLFSVIFNSVYSQAPGGINYQGVARDQYSKGLNTQLITLRYSIRKSSANGSVIFTETRNVTTDSFGVFSVVIGGPGATFQNPNIKQVNWSDTAKKFLQVEMDIHDFPPTGFLNMGTVQLMSVPFSFYSDITDSARAANTADSARAANKADSAKVAKGSGRYFFSATIPVNTFQPISNSGLSVYQIIKFPQLLYNEGNAYNPATHVFTAPDSGFYQFDFIINTALLKKTFNSNPTPPLYNVYYALMKNDNILLSSVYDEREHHILKLMPGDRIDLRIAVDYGGYYSNIQLGWDMNDAQDYTGSSSITVDPKVFAEFSGYRIK